MPHPSWLWHARTEATVPATWSRAKNVQSHAERVEHENDLGECAVCKSQGATNRRIKEPGRVGCPVCNTWLNVTDEDWVGVLLHQAEKLWRNPKGVAFRPWDVTTPLEGYGSLFGDAWLCLTLGRHNASIILLGASVESTLQEVLRVHKNEHFSGTLGSLVAYVEEEALIDQGLLAFVRLFAATVRNPWQHQKDAEIARGKKIKGKVMTLDKENLAESLISQMKALTRGEVKMDDLDADKDPVARLAVRNAMDESISYPLFNQCWWWTMLVHSRYLKSSNYERMRQRFDVSSPAEVKWKKGKGRVEISAREAPAIQRVLQLRVRDNLS